jgi:hypothetical protein
MKKVMHGLDGAPTSKQLEEIARLEMEKQFTDRAAGMGSKESTHGTGTPHKIQPLGLGTAISADVLGTH